MSVQPLNAAGVTPEVLCQKALEQQPKSMVIITIDKDGNPGLLATPLDIKDFAFIKTFIDVNVDMLVRQGMVLEQTDVVRR